MLERMQKQNQVSRCRHVPTFEHSMLAPL